MICDDCKEEDLESKWNGNDWILYCPYCGFLRYPTEQELKDLLCVS